MLTIVADPTAGLTVREAPAEHPQPGEVLVRVFAAGVNRADLLQAAGNYPPPPGASEVLGMEVSGVVAEIGDHVDGWSVGDPVCALLAGGGYAEFVRVPAGQLMPVPDGCDLTAAAGLPEVACTVWSNLMMTARLAAGQTLLLHGGGSGIGTHAIQVAKALGVRTAVTAGSPQKLDACRELGADICINYREQDFVAALHDATDGAGADVILDIIGAKYLDRNIDALAMDGRLVVIGMQGGAKGELNLGKLLAKRGGVFATALRARTVADKSAIVREVVEHVWPLIATGRVRPIIGAEFPLAEAQAAHRALEAGDVTGKILLRVAG
ncbi:NAD(P)H-quinone oxidoreductase [Mycobacterium sp. MYCO198283]|uniref:NAD(P)H-quinone oxidoreductase n=1 Tax=Mycobacterium sp. MYCO198283 TaxID=2883505 RepID=UPI001E40E01C|nr:NAD(P)H-quinone oxidoreductase [Mycobacterium sp. MYCO198283]MCG5432948.1 NAD(P)H-quinone oxidoreductase [Mycobacterium sp. MYCO198283]